MPKDGKGAKIDKAKAILKKFAIPIAGVSAATIIAIAAALSNKEDQEEAFVFHSLSDLSPEEFKKLQGSDKKEEKFDPIKLGKGLVADGIELKKCKDKADKFKADHPRTSKLIGLGEPKERPKRRKENNWVKHVKAYAEKHNLSYRDAMKGAGATYQKTKK